MVAAVLRNVEDPRDALEKANLGELERFARAHNIAFKQGMPAIVLRQMLRAKGLTNIAIPPRTLGQPPNMGGPVMPVDKSAADVVADLARQWATEDAKPKAPQNKPVSDMNITELRKTCKAKGIKLLRTDNMEALKAKLNG